jgi:hypothetical protein
VTSSGEPQPLHHRKITEVYNKVAYILLGEVVTVETRKYTVSEETHIYSSSMVLADLKVEYISS